MRNRCGSDSAHGNNFSAIHVPAAGNGLKDPEARRISQGFRYSFNLSAVHEPPRSVADLPPFPPEMFRGQRNQPNNHATDYFDAHLNIELLRALGAAEGELRGEGQADN